MTFAEASAEVGRIAADRQDSLSLDVQVFWHFYQGRTTPVLKCRLWSNDLGRGWTGATVMEVLAAYRQHVAASPATVAAAVAALGEVPVLPEVTEVQP